MEDSSRSAALSKLYSQGEKSWTCCHWRTAWAGSGPASSTIGVMPRSRTCAAAARPTGPAPMIATVFASLIPFLRFQLQNIQIHGPQNLRGGLCFLRGDLAGVGAAFGDQKVDEIPHGRIVGMADQGSRFAHLCDKADGDQCFDVMRKRGGRDLEPVLQFADRHPGLARADQRAVDLEPCRIAQGFEVGRGVVEFHVSLM